MAEFHRQFRIICGWCKKDMGPAPSGTCGDTHTICDKCIRKRFPEHAEQILADRHEQE